MQNALRLALWQMQRSSEAETIRSARSNVSLGVVVKSDKTKNKTERVIHMRLWIGNGAPHVVRYSDVL